MVTSLTDSLTAQFYAWEQRGRGWTVWDEPVELEPAFVPFERVYLRSDPGFDDGRRSHAIVRFLRWAGGSAGAHPVEEPPWASGYAERPSASLLNVEYAEMQVRLSTTVDYSLELAEQVLLSLASLGGRAAFELLGTEGDLVLQLAVPACERANCRRVLETYLPDASIDERSVLAPLWAQYRRHITAVVDFGLSDEFMLPLRIPRSLSLDPLLAFVSALRSVGADEVGLLQVLFQPVSPGWAVSSLRAMSDGEGKAFFADAPETLALTRQKLSRPLLACCIRVAAKAASEQSAWALAQRIGSALSQFSLPQSNELIPLANDGYPDHDHAEDVVTRSTRRCGMLLSSAELAGVAHFPSRSAAVEELRSVEHVTKVVPPALVSGQVHLGRNRHRDREQEVWLRAQDRLRHVHLIGATGTGKSTLLLHLIRQDIEAGRGFALLDPHGDLADDVLALIPPEREQAVIVFDPSDEDHPVGFNVLEAHTDRERELLASDLVAVFRRFTTTWGDQMTSVLGNAVLAFLESPAGGSLLDLRHFLLNKKMRDRVLLSLDDPMVRSFWADQFPRLSGRPATPILTRLDTFLRPRSIRNVVCQEKSGFDLAKIMDQGGIFIGKLAQGAIGEQNAHLLGSLLVAKFQQAAMGRESQAESSRRPFFLYIDEFHHFMTPSVAALLSGARKYGLGLLLAHQELRQLQDKDMRSAVLANAGTRICFRVGDEDARTLAHGLRSFEATDLMSLGVGEAICRVGQADWDFTLRTDRVSMPEEAAAKERRDTIRSLSRSRHASDREIVEATIRASYPHTAPARAVRKPARPVEPAPKPVAPPSLAVPVEARSGVEGPIVQGPSTPSSPGRGGPEHKYLQALIKSYGESRGFRATIEAPVGSGESIDVLLEHEGLRIACEISVTTSAKHELGNVRKSLDAGIECVVVVSPTATALRRIERRAKDAFSEAELDCVLFLTPQDFLAYVDERSAVINPERSEVLGYKVRTRLKAAGADQAARSQGVAKTIADALRRLRGK